MKDYKPNTAVKIEGKFYPLQHQEWVKACKELTSSARDTLYYIRTADPYSNGIELTAAAIAKELGVNRSTISRALKELDAKGYIEMEIISAKVNLIGKGLLDVAEMQHCCADATSGAEMQQPVQECNGQCRNATGGAGMQQPTSETFTQSEVESSKTLNIYQEYIKTLSENERENFLNFCKKSVEHYKKPVVNLDDYLASVDATGQERWTLLRNKWHQSKQLAYNGVLNAGLKGVDEKIINLIDSSDPRIRLINRLKKDWGEREYSRLISTIHDGWIYFLKTDNTLPLEQATGIDSKELKAIAEGGSNG